MSNFEAAVYEKGYPSFDAVNRKEEKSVEEFVNYIMSEVSDENITDLFQEMGIEINLNKPWEDEDA